MEPVLDFSGLAGCYSVGKIRVPAKVLVPVSGIDPHKPLAAISFKPNTHHATCVVLRLRTVLAVLDGTSDFAQVLPPVVGPVVVDVVNFLGPTTSNPHED
jgi:hypothetical protein